MTTRGGPWSGRSRTHTAKASLIATQKLYAPLGIDLGVAKPAKRDPKTKWDCGLTEPSTYGDHVRAKRLALGLFRREAAELIGVDTTTVYNWESSRVKTAVRHVPGVIRFLGYCPYEPAPPTPEWLKLVRQCLGLSQEMIADAVGVDEGTWRRWEVGRRQPAYRYLERIDAHLSLLSEGVRL